MSARLRGIIVLVCDQLRADHLGFGGNRDVATPALDRLASGSVVFDRAYVANPTCMPNRVTISTGRWPSVHGTRTNGVTLDWNANTLMRTLRRAGWATSAVGKLHFQNMGWPWEPHEIEDMVRTDPLLLDPQAQDAVLHDRPTDWDRWEDHARHAQAMIEMPPDYYGFETVDLVVGHGDAPSGHYLHWARERGVDPQAVGGYARAREKYAGWDEVWRSEVPVAAHPTTYVTERLVERLEGLAAGSRPFFLFGSFPDPHHPYAPPAPYWARYDPAAVGVPDSFDAAHEGLPEHVQRILDARGRPGDRTYTWAPDEDQLRHSLAAEYGLISFIDDGVARLLARLDDLGLQDEVAIVFTSDHGDLFGDHGLMLKHGVHYAGLTRVPLSIRRPGAAPGRIADLTSSADICPTVLELAGVPAFRGIQGRSLVPHLGGQAATGLDDRALIVEEEHPFGLLGLPAPVRIRTLLTRDARLTLYSGQRFGELYAHDDDPLELHNRWDDADAGGLRGALTERLARELLVLGDTGIAPIASA
jgi:arylsulfatase A-like enzyme